MRKEAVGASHSEIMGIESTMQTKRVVRLIKNDLINNMTS